MNNNAMRLKAKIRNIANEKNLPAQIILQNFMFERFLERLSKSKYQDRFILKGGMLIAALVGIEKRATMDMDATMKKYPINPESITQMTIEICSVPIDDGVTFEVNGVEAIRNDDVYGGFRIGITSRFDRIITPLKLDITTGDAITPKEVFYSYKLAFQEGSIGIWTYNIETILAEKVETILRRGELNTRPRDFYDVFILTKTQSFNHSIFAEALKITIEHRGTSHILNNLSERYNDIGSSKPLEIRWENYSKDYSYAQGIPYKNVIDAVGDLLQYLTR